MPFSDNSRENLSHLRVPPQSLEAEQSVLGGLMLENDAWNEVGEKLMAGDFYRQDHAKIFAAIAHLAELSEPFDVITVSDYLEKNNELSQVGGLAYLGQLVKDTPSAANIKAYAKVVTERSTLRALIKVGSSITSSAYETEGREIKHLVDDAERMVFNIAERNSRSGKSYVEVKNVLGPVFNRLKELEQSDSQYTGLVTGFTEFDNLTSGLQKGDLIIVAGRPSMGKTTLAVNMAEHAAIGLGESVVIFSMEMSSEQLVMRMISSLGRINQTRLRAGRLQPEDWNSVSSAMSLLKKSKIFIDDTPAMSPNEIRARARRIKREHGLGLVMVDYLQLMQVQGGSENRATEISEISRSLKALARELEVPVIALSQLNRSVEQRQDKKPVLSDLRESGAIEQDADVITFIYRDDFYNKDPSNPRKGQADIIIGKQRNGPTDTVVLKFLGEYTKFENFIPNDYPDIDYLPD
ncbi:MAG: replicative DNA helicase [Gammaproteobacteria bacterium]|nr:replicative DNA helicase [Gammaproteobacteria bacterium]NNM13083.1 replicative DNA helicase [Gammaproteobacteria bacterium]